MLAGWLMSQQIELANTETPQRYAIKIPRTELRNTVLTKRILFDSENKNSGFAQQHNPPVAHTEAFRQIMDTDCGSTQQHCSTENLQKTFET